MKSNLKKKINNHHKIGNSAPNNYYNILKIGNQNRNQITRYASKLIILLIIIYYYPNINIRIIHKKCYIKFILYYKRIFHNQMKIKCINNIDI